MRVIATIRDCVRVSVPGDSGGLFPGFLSSSVFACKFCSYVNAFGEIPSVSVTGIIDK